MVLVLITYRGWQKQNTYSWLHKNTALKILLISIAYGLAVEILQELLTPDRHFDIYDAVANAAGGVGGVALCKWLTLFHLPTHHQIKK
jgi:hypothetical protein